MRLTPHYPKYDFKEVILSELTKIRITQQSQSIHLFWNNIKIFSIYNQKVLINSNTGLDESFIRYLFLGHVFGILLNSKGRLVLHGNSVNINNGAIIFLGTSGKGKSTTSLALHKKGYKLIADDVLSIDCENITVYPSFPRIKLWPETIKNVGENPKKMTKVHYKTEKLFYDVSKDFSHEVKLIKAIYLIENGDKTFLKEIDPFKSLTELIKSSYCFKLFSKDELAENLKQCTKLINNIPIKTLTVKSSFHDLDNLIKIIEMDLTTI